jgi:putative endonuclease
MRDHEYFVYILASTRNGTLYIGVTNDVWSQVAQHKRAETPGLTQKYGVHRLVYFESYGDVYEAIGREKQLKGWNRAWKIRLIEKLNPTWEDLYEHPEVIGAFDG